MPVARALVAVPAQQLARRLLGAVLVSGVGGTEVAIRLTEVEAYEGQDDPASHAFRGVTRRTAVMFGPPGHLYCYFTYGMHWCANIVCDVEGRAAAVLLRAGEVVHGSELAWTRRPAAKSAAELARGPARLASCLGLGSAHSGVDLCNPAAVVRLESMPRRKAAGVRAGPRVGVAKAAERPWRFWLPDEPSVSAFRPGGRKRVAPDRQTDPRE
ncbi:MAG: DNA-3-methyladenine glycosylase [Pseudonocardiales bacterium]|uniref:Putative 3-methyladenine DNA glycosylase n=1 Tax=Candidatus Aeolococcus gillhamiae TaxID=3127015 RepID=A0A2W5Z825_9BACT|nr:MAG: DNA-3-methyladenine glycosylase [Candidatus Dormibacter sp. RRmetagenome_bin12]PZS18416.1 MAG: DNA-3-methyladenine glycosylase [Pseudonocardiales bacterium]